MPYEKRQIIEAYFSFDGINRTHPAVILSKPSVYDQEGYYICAMITSKAEIDEFSFVIKKGDTTKAFKKNSQVRLQLIAPVRNVDIVKNSNISSFTVRGFERLIDHIVERVFGVNAIPIP